MNGHILVTLFKTVVLLDVMQVVTPDDDRPLHLRGDAHALEDFTTDAHVPCEGALLIHVFTLLGLFWGRKTEANVPPIPSCPLRLFPNQAFGPKKNGVLLLEGFLVLIHVCSTLLHGCKASGGNL